MKNGIFGGVAQLVERSVRIREVMGSNPTVSTKKASAKAGAFFVARKVRIRTGRRTAVRKKAAGGRFFSPRMTSHRLHQKSIGKGRCFFGGKKGENGTGRRTAVRKKSCRGQVF